jgi:hypothetical protein
LNWTATNQSSVPVTIPDTPGQFTVTNSLTGAQVFSASTTPTAPTVTIAPHQTFTQSVTWPDNSPNLPAGAYSASFQNPSFGGTTGFDLSSPSSGAPPEPGALVATLETPQASYQIDRPVAITLTLTNDGTTPVALSQLSKSATFQLSRGSTLLWRSARIKLAARAAQAIAPGQSIELRGLWAGKPQKGHLNALKPGVYQLEGTAGGYSAYATIRLTAR